MKELTYEDWMKNQTPRMMWVWDDDENVKTKYKVVYFSQKRNILPVIAVTDDEKTVISFKHCAEIEEPKARRMTNKELSRWLREKPTREYKYKNGDAYIYGYYEYKEYCANEELKDIFLIREDDGDWKEPLVEVEE